MNIEGYLAGSELTNANVIKEEVIKALARDGLLTCKPEYACENYAVVMHKRGWLGAAWARLWGADDKAEYRVNVVKVV